MLSSGYGILMQVVNAFIVSMIFGFALLKTYDLIRKSIKENQRMKIWWGFSLVVFMFSLIVLLFGGKI